MSALVIYIGKEIEPAVKRRENKLALTSLSLFSSVSFSLTSTSSLSCDSRPLILTRAFVSLSLSVGVSKHYYLVEKLTDLIVWPVFKYHFSLSSVISASLCAIFSFLAATFCLMLLKLVDYNFMLLFLSAKYKHYHFCMSLMLWTSCLNNCLN